MSTGERARPAKFRISSFETNEEAFEVSGEVQLDQNLNQFPDSIDLYGSERDELKLMGFVGALVQLEDLTVRFERRTYVARVHSVTSSSSSSPDQIGKVAELSVKKAVSEFERREDNGTRYCSFTYSTDVVGWPSPGMFSLSYEGTIGLTRFEDGLHSLLKSDDFHLTATPHFYFRDEGRKLVRQRLASIQLKWTREDLDAKRLIDCGRVVLAFMYAVKLRPLAKTSASDGNYRRVSWSPSDLETADRERFQSPIPVPDQQQFQATAIETLFRSEYPIEFLDGIVDRYVELRIDVALDAPLRTDVRQLRVFTPCSNRECLPPRRQTMPTSGQN